MKYAETVIFCKVGNNTFNYETGEYESDETSTRKEYMCNVSDTKWQAMEFLYGKQRIGAKTIKVYRPDTTEYDYVLYAGTKYHIDKRTVTRLHTIFYVSGNESITKDSRTRRKLDMVRKESVNGD